MKLLFAFDGSEHALEAADVVRSLPLPRGSEVSVVIVFPKDSALDPAEQRSALDNVKATLKLDSAEVTWSQRHGHPAEQITKIADELQPDLIVVGAYGLHARLGILLGGVAQQVVEHARWPVLVARAPSRALRRVLLVTDGSPDSQLATAYLGQFPLPAEAKIRVLHVLPPQLPPEVVASNWPVGPRLVPTVPMSETVAARLAQRTEDFERAGQAIVNQAVETLKAAGVQAGGSLARGEAASEILQYVKTHDVDLIVAGSRGLSAVQGWLLGSISRKLVHYAGCSVLVVRQPDNSAG
jgi:nucleotide-binding universal stress UspA family protein